MPRKPRFNLPGYPQHVVQRGNNRQPTFFSPADYRFYLECLYKACNKYLCSVHAYVLMTNHVHLLLTPEQSYSVSEVMQATGRRYVRYINDRYGRSGSLWEGRYKASLVEQGNYVLACYRYIELNPVRAGMVEKPAAYLWSSYRCNALGETNSLITPNTVYLALGTDRKNCQRAYLGLFTDLAPEELGEVRYALNHELVFGREEFKDGIQQETKRRTRLHKVGRPAGSGRVY